MTPKEKAQELVEKFIYRTNDYVTIEDAKKCALIAVDEKEVTAQKMEVVLTAAASMAEFDEEVVEAIRMWCGQMIDELNELKTEIEKL